MAVQLRVIGPKGEELITDVCDSDEQMKRVTVRHLKKKITRELFLDESDDIRMVFRTKTLEEGTLLVTYGIQHMSVIHTLMKVFGGS